MTKPNLQDQQQNELFRIPLEKIIDPSHELVLLADKIDWNTIENHFSQFFSDGPGGRPLRPRLAVGLNLIKYRFDLSDEETIEKFVDSPYCQYFCGMKYFEHKLPCDSSSLTKWRNRMGGKGAEKILKETLDLSLRNGLISKEEFEQVFIDTTVQEKNIAFPTDARLYAKARRLLVKQAKKEGIKLKQTFEKDFENLLFALSKGGRKKPGHKKKTLKSLKTKLGKLIRDIRRKAQTPSKRLQHLLALATKLYNQKKSDKNKIYSLHEPQVKCIAKGKANKQYEFGNKVSISTTVKNNFVVGCQSFVENVFDGKTLSDSLCQMKDLCGMYPKEGFVDQGYKGYEGQIYSSQIYRQGLKSNSPRVKELCKKRARVEPVISHLKSDHRMGRNYLKGIFGDAINCLWAACAFNLRKAGKMIRKIDIWAIFREIFAFYTRRLAY